MIGRTLTLISLLLISFAGCSDDDGVFADGGVPGKDGPGGGQDQKVGPPVSFTLATWNVKNFFDEKDDAAVKDDVLTAAQVQKKMQQLGAAIRGLDADVLVLQEVEKIDLLQRLNNTQLSKMKYKEVRLLEGNDLRGIDVALLSRFEVLQYITNIYDTFPGVKDPNKNYGFSRDCVLAKLKLGPGRELRLLINHLRAGGDYNSTRRREAQAQRVRVLADQVLKGNPQENLSVIGDLNDTPDTETIKLIRDKAPNLYDPLTLLQASLRKTFRRSKQLDYMLLSPGLKADLDNSSVMVPYDSLFSTTSDHYPIRARFNLK